MLYDVVANLLLLMTTDASRSNFSASLSPNQTPFLLLGGLFARLNMVPVSETKEMTRWGRERD